jgi:hypothetical protein
MVKKEENFSEILKQDRAQIKRKSFENVVAVQLFDEILQTIVNMNRANIRRLVYVVPVFLPGKPIFDRKIVASKIIKKLVEKKLKVSYEKENFNFSISIEW